MWADVAFGCSAAVWVATTASSLVHQRWVRRLPALAAFDGPGSAAASTAVRCSVVVAARDEALRIEATVRHLLAQRGVAVDVIVVDDRSTDSTGAILRRLAAEDSRVRPARVDVLPDGWLGKCHACHVGASLATGDWILFVDADCWLKPDVIERALRVADREAADHVALTPGVRPETLAAAAWHLVFLANIGGWIARVNGGRRGAYVGIGAFNLVRAGAYQACGGYERLRLTVVDDMKLGLLLARAGKRTRAFIGGDDAECQWGTTMGSIFKLMEKNFFAVIDFRLAPVIAVGLVVPLSVAAALAGLWTGTMPGLAAGLAPLSLAIPGAVYARRLGWPLRSAALVPLVYPIMIAAFLNSASVTLRQGGIWWRQTFYSLDTLRRGNVR